MGNNCCHKQDSEYHDNITIDQFYDPFAELKSYVKVDPSLLERHGPKNAIQIR